MRIDVYWSHSYLPEAIRPDGVVFDFGVNNGGFSRLVAPLCSRVIGFEPDPRWAGAVTLPGNVQIERKALAASAGKTEFHTNRSSCASLRFAEIGTETIAIDAVTLAQAFALAPSERIELVKMDIEGEEVPVLLEAPAKELQRIVQLTVEFHDFIDRSAIPAIRAVLARMEQLGFHSVRFSWHSYGDMLFINERFLPLSLLERLWLRLRFKYLRGLARIVRRAFKQ